MYNTNIEVIIPNNPKEEPKMVIKIIELLNVAGISRLTNIELMAVKLTITGTLVVL